ncbi:hypothetical protein pb186bvf_011428 [Paramecium bursaria]
MTQDVKYIHASSQTDLIDFAETQEIKNDTQIQNQQPYRRKNVSIWESLIQKQIYSSKSRQIKRAIVQNRHRVLTIICVNEHTQFIDHIIATKYFQIPPELYFNTYVHTSYNIITVPITNNQGVTGVCNYKDILTITKKNRIYDTKLNKLIPDVSLSFVEYCPDIVIVSNKSLTEEINIRRKQQNSRIKQPNFEQKKICPQRTC